MRLPVVVLIAAATSFLMPSVSKAADLETHSHELKLVAGVEGDGIPSQLWIKMVHRLHGGKAKPSSAKPLTSEEAAWTRLIAARMPAWHAEISSLAQNFESVEPPAIARIVVGNQGGEDAFTFDAQTIGFDVSRLLANYGRSDLQENHNRLDRFFRHEYTHLLQKQWLQQHPYSPKNPLEAALFGVWTEGLGNYYSLSDRWFGTDGALSGHARDTLERLSHRLVERMTALSCATPDEADALLSDLSIGAFEQKWGALPTALWLATEAQRSPDALRRFVDGGPAGAWEFLKRNLPEQSQLALLEARAAAESCALYSRH